MKNILILVASLSLFGCAKDLPKYPESLKEFHLVTIKGVPLSGELTKLVRNLDDLEDRVQAKEADQVECLHFQVVKVNPYEFKFLGGVPVTDCHEVSGYKPDENMVLWNWIDDVLKFGEEKKCYDKQ